jgi:tellurite resistance protein
MRGMSTTTPEIAAAAPVERLAYLPVALFGSVMGLSGLALAWRLANQVFGVPAWIGEALGGIALLAFVALAIAYGVKWASAPAVVQAEFNHPIAGNFFATFIISLLLLPAVVAPWWHGLANALWILGTVLMVAFAWLVVRRWMSVRQHPAHATPAWIVPVIGTLDVPIAGIALGLPGAHAISTFALAVGLWFTVPLFTLILSRLLFEEPLPPALQPALLILVAPFAVGFSAYVNVAGEVDLFAYGLFYLALFMFAVLLPKMLTLPSCCPFRTSWWAVSFPLAALTIASLKVAALQPDWPARVLAMALLALTSATIAALAWRTLAGIARGQLKALTS